MQALARTPQAAARRDTVAKILLDALDAPNTAKPRTPRKEPQHTPWQPMYGWNMAIVGDGILNAEGKHTSFKLVREFTHDPGDMVMSRGGKRTNKRGASYMVRTDHSLRKI